MANITTETDFTLQQDSYASFDALTLKQLMKQRLNDGGVYTDQTFEGSNMSSIIDVIAFSYHTLLFYLNRTSAETMFTDATIYENMNRIVKLVDYKPKGYQTSLLPFNVDVNLKGYYKKNYWLGVSYRSSTDIIAILGIKVDNKPPKDFIADVKAGKYDSQLNEEI